MSSHAILARSAASLAPAPAKTPSQAPAPAGRTSGRPPLERRRRTRSAGIGTLHALAWASIALTIAIYFGDRGLSGWDGLKESLKSAGILAGMVSGDLMCVMVLLAARIPFVERLMGQDKAIARHSGLGSWVVGGVLTHGVLVTASYAMSANTSFLDEFTSLWSFRDYALAVVSGGLLLAVGLTSAVLALRKQLPHQLWYGVHLTTYVAMALSIPHMFSMDNIFESGWARVYWIGLYLLTAFCLIAFRVVLPVLDSATHRLVVSEVRREDHETISITMTGRDLAELDARAGQFFTWRFWAPSLVWEAHPFSLSQAPDGNSLRITVRMAGEGTRRLLQLRPGTRVSFEGPYGVFTSASRTREAVVLVGSGSGIAPIRALAEETPVLPGRALVVLRASRPEELLHFDEVQSICRARGIQLVTLVGHRGGSWVPAASGNLTLVQLAPWLADADLYACGPDAWMAKVVDEAQAYGVHPSQIHAERFDY